MAESVNSMLPHQLRGQIGKQIAVKHYGKKTVVTVDPDISKVKPGKLQKRKPKVLLKLLLMYRIFCMVL